MAQRDLYEILGVPRSATPKEIREAYRRVARENHPDRNAGNAAAEERFKEASFARSVLLDQGKRELYDEFGELGLREGFDAEAYRGHSANAGRFTNLQDLFRRGSASGGAGFEEVLGPDVLEALFGRRAGGRPRPPRDMLARVTVSFAEAIRGVERELELPGGVRGRTVRVRIPPGVEDGGRVRLKGRAARGGDVVLQVEVQEHPFFRREGNDLLLALPVTVGEAFLGTKVEVPTPDGPVNLRIPAGARGGSRLRLRGRGVRRGDAVGDLIVQLQIILPEPRTRAEKAAVDEAIEKLEAGYGGSPRGDIKL